MHNIYLCVCVFFSHFLLLLDFLRKSLLHDNFGLDTKQFLLFPLFLMLSMILQKTELV